MSPSPCPERRSRLSLSPSPSPASPPSRRSTRGSSRSRQVLSQDKPPRPGRLSRRKSLSDNCLTPKLNKNDVDAFGLPRISSQNKRSVSLIRDSFSNKKGSDSLSSDSEVKQRSISKETRTSNASEFKAKFETGSVSNLSKITQSVPAFIEGQNSGDIYAFATSILNLKTLPQFVQEQLISGKIGIGELLRDQGLETYRQVIDIFREIQHNIVPNLASVYCGEMVCRTYFIYYNKIPVIQVTEKFPFRLYQRK